MKKPKKIEGKCFACGKDVDHDDYCYGCKAYVCDECDQRQYTGAIGPHKPEDHLHHA